MKGKRIQIGAVLLALVMTLSVVSFGIAGAAPLADGQPSEDAQLAEIGPAVQDAAQDGDMITALVMLEDLDSEVIEAQGISALQAHAQTTQEPLMQMANDEPAVEVQNEFWITNAVAVSIDTSEFDVENIASMDAVERLIKDFDVQTPEPPEVSSDAAPEADGDVTYGLDQVNAPEAWNNYDVDGDDARVAVLDTGVDASHPDIDVAQFAEFDGNGEVVSTDPFDAGQHGTHVSGTVSGGDASGEHVGVAPNVQLMVGQVLQGENNGASSVLGGMQWAVQNDADVISMSLGTRANTYVSAYIEPVQNARDAGVMVVAASGNGGQEGDGVGKSGSPANIFETLAVGATNSGGSVAQFSNGEEINTQQDFGSDAPSSWPSSYIVPDVSAPGVNTKSTIPGGEYSEFSGTSMATPHVSGVLALMVDAAEDRNQDYTVEDLRNALVDSTFKPSGDADSQDIRYGYGIVDANAAIDSLLEGDGPGPDPPEGELGFEIGNADELEQGDTFTVELSSTGDQAFAGFETTVDYNSDALNLVETNEGDMDNLVTDTADGVISLSAVSSDEASDQLVAEMTFEVATDQADTYNIEFRDSETEASDAAGNLLEINNLEGGQATVVESTPEVDPGDVNEDGEVNIADATLLQQYVVGEDVDINMEAADLNDDGSVNTADLIAHLEFLTNLDN